MDNKTFTAALARKMGCDVTKAQHLLDGFRTLLREECSMANRVAIPGFGSFTGEKHPEEIAADLATGRRMLLPPSVEMTFAAGTMLKKRLKEEGNR